MADHRFDTAAVALCLVMLGLLAPAAHGGEVHVVPSGLDLGEWPAGRVTEAAAWIVNATDTTARVTGIEATPAVKLATAVPLSIPPHAARPLKLTVRADPRAGDRLRASVRFTGTGVESLRLTITLASAHPDLRLAPATAGDDAWAPVRVAPHWLDLPAAAPGERRQATVWLINTGRRDLDVIAARGTCGCVELPDFSPRRLERDRVMPVTIAMLGKGAIGQLQVKHVTFVIDGEDPLTVELRMPVIDPMESRVRRYLDAIERDDFSTMRALLAVDARIAFGASDPGGPHTRDDGGPIPTWDRALNAATTYESFATAGSTVLVRRRTINDLYRLLDGDARETDVEFEFNEHREITAIRFLPQKDGDPERLEMFLEWAESTHPGSRQTLVPSGRIVPDPATADLWRERLAAWRRAFDLPPVHLGDAG
ncbi:MAG: hypothetical protein HKO59_12220 [Phycisphaerales bacterium]|nr:hypothetical protein [Phycisphaerales bacterium]NNM26728.1 hypothetical protein [Phycisphaerales bacterium]